MNKKRFVVLIVVISMLFLFTGCSYVAYKDYYSESEDYTNIWELTGFRHGYDDISPLFPESINDLEVIDFICRYDQQLPLGEGIQIFLEVNYRDADTFNMELEKITSMTFNCSSYFEESGLFFYATKLGVDSSSEYAVVDEEEMKVWYIYLQDLPKSEIEFDEKFIPIGYSDYGEIIQ